MNDLRSVCIPSIVSVESDQWDSIVEDHELYNTHAYLSAIEGSRIPDVEYSYFLFYQGHKLIAHASVAIFTFGLDIMIDGAFGRVIAAIKRAFPGFLRVKVIECGHPTTLGSSLVIDESSQVSRESILVLLDNELVALAGRHQTSLIDIRDVYSSNLEEFDALKSVGYRTISNMANTFFRIYQKSYREYLHDLTSKRRHEIIRRTEIFKKEGCTIEKVIDFAPLAHELAVLWRNTFERATEYQREILNTDYFRAVSESLKEKSFILLCKKNGRAIGFTMLIDSGNTLISTYCGLDYEQNRSTYAYFVLFYRSVQEAIESGKEWLELGVTNYNPKIEVGAMPEPMYILAKSTRRLLNLVLAPLLRALDVSPDYNKRHVFNNRFYERHPIAEDMTVNIGGEPQRVVDLSFEGLGTISALKPRDKKVNIRIEISDGHFIPLSGTLRNVEETEEGSWRAGYLVQPRSPDHVPLWHSLVARYSVSPAG